MNIDQRIEALTQSVELRAGVMRDNEMHANARFEELERSMTQLAKTMNRLANR